jgi:hypothetical protein
MHLIKKNGRILGSGTLMSVLLLYTSINMIDNEDS